MVVGPLEMQPEADARLELGGRSLERRVRGEVRTHLDAGRECSSARAGDGRELGADLSNAVAEGDHHVEPLSDELVEVLGAVRADVDAPPLKDPHGVGMQRLRVAPRARRFDRPGRHVLERAPRPSATGRCFPCTRTTPACGDARPGAVGPRPGQATTPDAGHRPQPAAPPGSGEIDGVVAVAAVRRTATGGHSPPSRSDASGTRPGSGARRPAGSAPAPLGRSAPVPQQPPPKRIAAKRTNDGGWSAAGRARSAAPPRTVPDRAANRSN